MNWHIDSYSKYIRYKLMGRFRHLDDGKGDGVKPYAFIRIKNEYPTVERCLNSILPAIDRGIIVYHELDDNEQDDGTIKILKKFCASNKGYKLIHYPHKVLSPGNERYSKLEEVPIENRLDTFYNFALSKIPENEWLIKIDCDQIYDTERLKKILCLPKNTNEMISIARLNLHYQDSKLYALKYPEVLYDPCDHWLIYNKKLRFDMHVAIDNGRITAVEVLKVSNRKTIRTNLLSYHFPCLKSYRRLNAEEMIPYKDYKFMKVENEAYRIEDKIFKEEYILKMCDNFRKG